MICLLRDLKERECSCTTKCALHQPAPRTVITVSPRTVLITAGFIGFIIALGTAMAFAAVNAERHYARQALVEQEQVSR